MRANGVLSLAEESTLRGIDFCPSVAQSQYTNGTSEMEEYNKAFLEKVAASVRENSMGRVDKSKIEEPTEDLDTTQESSFEEQQQTENANFDKRGGKINRDAAAGRNGSSVGKTKGEESQPDIFEEVVKIFEVVAVKLKEAVVLGTGKLKECYDNSR